MKRPARSAPFRYKSMTIVPNLDRPIRKGAGTGVPVYFVVLPSEAGYVGHGRRRLPQGRAGPPRSVGGGACGWVERSPTEPDRAVAVEALTGGINPLVTSRIGKARGLWPVPRISTTRWCAKRFTARPTSTKNKLFAGPRSAQSGWGFARSGTVKIQRKSGRVLSPADRRILLILPDFGDKLLLILGSVLAS